MDGSRFDDLTRALTTSRRSSIKTLLGGVLGAVLIDRFGNGLAAACKKVGENCDQNSDCCDGATCTNGKCKCKTDRTECNGKCYNLDRDEDHCGSCDIACASVETCCAGDCVDLQSDGQNCGSCAVACAAGETCCGACVNLQSDRDNCGACGAVCSFDEVCDDAECARIGELRCFDDNLTNCNDECVDLQSDRDHCGACDHTCAAGTRCCSGACVDIQSDVNHCGACGNICPEHASCCYGVCSMRDDLDNCGGCGLRCPEGTDRCLFGKCCYPGQAHPRSPECPEVGCCNTEPIPDCNHCPNGTRCCGQACADIQSDRANCGACSRACDTTAICANGQCVPCPPGRVVCGNVCCLP